MLATKKKKKERVMVFRIKPHHCSTCSCYKYSCCLFFVYANTTRLVLILNINLFSIGRNTIRISTLNVLTKCWLSWKNPGIFHLSSGWSSKRKTWAICLGWSSPFKVSGKLSRNEICCFCCCRSKWDLSLGLIRVRQTAAVMYEDKHLSKSLHEGWTLIAY